MALRGRAARESSRDWRRATSSSVPPASASWSRKRSGARRTHAIFARFTRYERWIARSAARAARRARRATPCRGTHGRRCAHGCSRLPPARSGSVGVEQLGAAAGDDGHLVDRGRVLVRALAQTLDDAREPFRVDRLQQVVERLDRERIDGVLRMRGHEDDRRRFGRSCTSGAAWRPVSAGHLDVEEDHVVRSSRRSSRASVALAASPTTCTSGAPRAGSGARTGRAPRRRPAERDTSRRRHLEPHDRAERERPQANASP